MNKVIFDLQKSLWTGGLGLHIGQRTEAGIVVAQNITFEPIKEGQITDPVLTLTQDEAQRLADSLYEAGIRPTAAAGSAGQLAAVTYHLEDMRNLVFKRGKS